ncbi:MAG: DUF2207 domain-containing protein [Acidobacteriota bacterium]
MIRAVLGRLLLALALAALPRTGLAAGNAERILGFDSRVVIAPTGDLTVTETIRVWATGASIRQGLVREFPTRYTASDGRITSVGFHLLSVRRDGHSEDSHTETAANGVKVYMGKKGRFISPGEHTYELTYATDGQIGQFAAYDELYWNVTGNGWRLPIDRATARIVLPPGAEIRQYAAYTGPMGARGEDYAVDTAEPGVFTCETTSPLSPGEGLTVAVAFQKGLIALPTPAQRALANQGFRMAASGLAVVTVFSLTAWWLVGRDPTRGLIVPLFAPPQGISAPAARYVRRMGFDDKTFCAGLVQMAVAGGLIIEDADDVYILARGKTAADKGSWQDAVTGDLLGSTPALRVTQANHAVINKARKNLEKNLKRDYEGSHFQVNRAFFGLGAALSVLAFGLTALRADNPQMAGMFILWLGIWTFGVAALTLRALTALRKAKARPRFTTLVAALFACLIAAPFLIGELVGAAFLSMALTLPATACLVAIAVLNALFHHLLKAPTPLGRQVMDALEGFRLYLSLGERERLDILHPPDRTPELFERYLPYALALDVEVAWTAQFADVLAQAAAEGYTPGWYVGPGFSSGDFSGFADGLGSGFSSAISSSATAPGSASGSGGGGSSGGGGGGGGGGGW